MDWHVSATRRISDASLAKVCGEALLQHHRRQTGSSQNGGIKIMVGPAHPTIVLSARNPELNMVVTLCHDLVSSDAHWRCSLVFGDKVSDRYDLALRVDAHDDRSVTLVLDSAAPGDQLPVKLPRECRTAHGAMLKFVLSLDGQPFTELDYNWLLDALADVPDTQQRLDIRFDLAQLPADIAIAEVTLLRESASHLWRLANPFTVIVKRSTPLTLPALTPASAAACQQPAAAAVHSPQRLLDVRCPARTLRLGHQCCPLPSNVVLLTFDARNEQEQVLFYVQNALVTMSYYYEPPRLSMERWAMYQSLFPYVRMFYEEVLGGGGGGGGEAAQCKTVQELDVSWRTAFVPRIMADYERSGKSARDFFNIPAAVAMEVLGIPLWGIERDRKFVAEVAASWEATSREQQALLGGVTEHETLALLRSECERTKRWAEQALYLAEVHMSTTFGQWSVLWDSTTNCAWVPAAASERQPLVFSTFMLQLHSQLFDLRIGSKDSVPMACAVFPFEAIRGIGAPCSHERAEGALAVTRVGKIVFRAEDIYEVVDYHDARPVMVLLNERTCQQLGEMRLQVQREDYVAPLFIPFVNLDGPDRESLFMRLWHGLFGRQPDTAKYIVKKSTTTTTTAVVTTTATHGEAIDKDDGPCCKGPLSVQFDWNARWLGNGSAAAKKTTAAAAALTVQAMLEADRATHEVNMRVWSGPGIFTNRVIPVVGSLVLAPIDPTNPKSPMKYALVTQVDTTSGADQVRVVFLHDTSGDVAMPFDSIRIQQDQAAHFWGASLSLFGPLSNFVYTTKVPATGHRPEGYTLMAIRPSLSVGPAYANSPAALLELSDPPLNDRHTTMMSVNDLPALAPPLRRYDSSQANLPLPAQHLRLVYYVVFVGPVKHNGYALVNGSAETLRILTSDGDINLAARLPTRTNSNGWALSRRAMMAWIEDSDIHARERIRKRLLREALTVRRRTGADTATLLNVTSIRWDPTVGLVLSVSAPGDATEIELKDDVDYQSNDLVDFVAKFDASVPLTGHPFETAYSTGSAHVQTSVYILHVVGLLVGMMKMHPMAERSSLEALGRQILRYTRGMFFSAGTDFHRVCDYVVKVAAGAASARLIDEQGAEIRPSDLANFVYPTGEVASAYAQQQQARWVNRAHPVEVLGWEGTFRQGRSTRKTLQLYAYDAGSQVAELRTGRADESWFASVLDLYRPRPVVDGTDLLAPNMRLSVDNLAPEFDGSKAYVREEKDWGLFVEQPLERGTDTSLPTGVWCFCVAADDNDPVPLLGFFERAQIGSSALPGLITPSPPDLILAAATAESFHGVRGGRYMSNWRMGIAAPLDLTQIYAAPPLPRPVSPPPKRTVSPSPPSTRPVSPITPLDLNVPVGPGTHVVVIYRVNDTATAVINYFMLHATHLYHLDDEIQPEEEARQQLELTGDYTVGAVPPWAFTLKGVVTMGDLPSTASVTKLVKAVDTNAVLHQLYNDMYAVRQVASAVHDYPAVELRGAPSGYDLYHATDDESVILPALSNPKAYYRLVLLRPQTRGQHHFFLAALLFYDQTLGEWLLASVVKRLDALHFAPAAGVGNIGSGPQDYWVRVDDASQLGGKLRAHVTGQFPRPLGPAQPLAAVAASVRYGFDWRERASYLLRSQRDASRHMSVRVWFESNRANVAAPVQDAESLTFYSYVHDQRETMLLLSPYAEALKRGGRAGAVQLPSSRNLSHQGLIAAPQGDTVVVELRDHSGMRTRRLAAPVRLTQSALSLHQNVLLELTEVPAAAAHIAQGQHLRAYVFLVHSVATRQWYLAGASVLFNSTFVA